MDYTPCIVLPERGTFLRLRYIKRVGISLYRKFSCSLATLVEVS